MTEQNERAHPDPQHHPDWGLLAPQPPKRPRSWRKAAGAVAIAGVVVAGGTVAMSANSAASASGNPVALDAASSSIASGASSLSGATTTSSGTSGSSDTASAVPPEGHRMGPGGRMGMAGALHGDFVVAGTTKGTYVTRRFQHGEVTAMANGSLTVKSADGYSSSYTVGNVPLTGIAVKDTVTVVATVTGSKATLQHIREKGTDPDPAWGRHGGHGRLPGGSPGPAGGQQQDPGGQGTTGSSAPTTS